MSAPMMPKWKRVVVGVVGLVVLQAGAVIAYRTLTSPRAHDDGGAIASVPADFALPAISMVRPGREARAASTNGVLVVHLWATWCAPCREELPQFLALDAVSDVAMIALSVDENWAVVEHFFDGDVPANVWRIADKSVRFTEPTLPETWLVEDGRIVARARGQQPWTQPAFNEWLAANQRR